MKFLQLLVVVCCSTIVVLSESTGKSEQLLLARASAQLERLAPYRRLSSDPIKSTEKQLLDNVAKDPLRDLFNEEQIALEIYRMLPENLQKDIVRKAGGNQEMAELLANPKYMAMMQERIKRSESKHGTKRDGYTHDGYEAPPDGGYPPPEEYGGYGPETYAHNGYGGGEHYGNHAQPSGSDSSGIIKGSTSLIGGIAKGIIGGLVSASGSASKGSSSISGTSSSQSSQASLSSTHHKPEYGQGYSYGDKAFDVWDFKKAIVSTLMQAVKAISGGVIALKGQLIKGSGYLVSSKGKIITKAGDAITSLGRNIAKSAVHPHTEPPHHGYSYDHPPDIGHESYEGPPPGLEDVGPGEEYHENSNYESPSDVDDQAGLLIVKPTKPDDHDDHHVDVDHAKPALTQPEDSYHGPPPGFDEKDVGNAVLGNVDSYQNSNDGKHVETHEPHGRPPSSYDVPIYYHTFDDQKKGQAYPNYPPLASGSPVNLQNPLSIQQSVEYPPIHIRYKIPGKGSLDLSNGDTSSNDLSMYTSLSISTDPLELMKIPPSKYGHGFELPKLQPATNFHSLPFPNTYAGAMLQQPLKIPLLNPLSTSYWQNPGLLRPLSSFDLQSLYRRRSSGQRRRSVSNIAQRMRLHPA